MISGNEAVPYEGQVAEWNINQLFEFNITRFSNKLLNQTESVRLNYFKTVFFAYYENTKDDGSYNGYSINITIYFDSRTRLDSTEFIAGTDIPINPFNLTMGIRQNDRRKFNIIREKNILQKELYLRTNSLSWLIVGGKNTEAENLSRQIVIFENSKLTVSESSTTQKNNVQEAFFAGLKILIKFFVIFDILTNFVSKVNVELTPYLDE